MNFVAVVKDKGKLNAVGVRLNSDQYRKLKVQAAKANVSVAALANQMVNHCLNQDVDAR